MLPLMLDPLKQRDTNRNVTLGIMTLIVMTLNMTLDIMAFNTKYYVLCC